MLSTFGGVLVKVFFYEALELKVNISSNRKMKKVIINTNNLDVLKGVG